MVKKRVDTKWLKLVAAILTIAVLAHTYYSIYGSAKITSPNGISGKAVLETVQETTAGLDTVKRVVLGLEWFMVISIFVVTLMKSKMEFKSVDEVIITPKKTKSNISKTDIDTMYEILKERKKLRLKTLSKYFKVEDSTILEWARVLEEANLVTVHYPTIGDPQIILNEEVKHDEA